MSTQHADYIYIDEASDVPPTVWHASVPPGTPFPAFVRETCPRATEIKRRWISNLRPTYDVIAREIKREKDAETCST